MVMALMRAGGTEENAVPLEVVERWRFLVLGADTAGTYAGGVVAGKSAVLLRGGIYRASRRSEAEAAINVESDSLLGRGS